MHSFNIFYGTSFFEHERTKYELINNEIRSRTDEYILQVDEDKYIDYLVDKYKYNLLTFYFDKESIDENNNTITYTCHLMEIKNYWNLNQTPAECGLEEYF